jgi:hypothetical protein
MTASKSPLVRFVQFLGKVKFTTVLLLGGAVIMTIGTIVESRESREVAWSAVYGTPWFDVFLFLIGVNLVLAVVNRIPIRRHQWPFVVTHFSIVMLLVGAWISTTFGYEGRLVVTEGSEESRLLLDTSEIRTRWHPGAHAAGPGHSHEDHEDVVEAAFPVATNRRLAGLVVQEGGEGRPEIRIAEYIEDGVATVELAEAGPGGPPGVEFLVTSGQQQVERWLIAGDPRSQRVDLGPFEIEFRLGEPEALPTGAESAGAEVVVTPIDGGPPVRIPVPAQLGQEVACGPSLVAEVQQFFRNARVVDGKLTELPSGPGNPAAVVEIRSEHGTEIHTVFSNFPQFNAIRGRDANPPLVAGVGLTASALLAKAQVAILLGADQQLHVQLTNTQGLQRIVPIAVGQTVELDGQGLGLRLQRLLESAQPEIRVRPSPEGRESGASYVRVEARLTGETGQSRALWLGRGAPARAASLDGAGTIEVAFGPQSRPLPFAIALEEFDVVHYPGSSRPAEYSSRVQVKPAGSDLPQRTEVISMNRPLDVEGFRLFQSSYQLGQEGRPDATILTVAYDPGVPIVYVSFVLIILGIAWGLRGVRPKSQPAADAPDPQRHRSSRSRRPRAGRSWPMAGRSRC